MSVLAWGLVTFLLIDKFLFRGKLAGLFIGGWRELMRSRWNRVRRLSCRMFGTVLREESGPKLPDALPFPEQDESLIVRKSYVDGLERSGADTPSEGESDERKGDTFTPEAQGVHSWKAPRSTDQNGQNPPANREKADTKEKDSEWDNLDGPSQESTDWTSEQLRSLSPKDKQMISDLLNQVDDGEQESPPFFEEERRDPREPDF